MSQRTKVIGYVRVSTKSQAEDGVSLKAQDAKLRAYAELYDLELVDLVIDGGASAGTLERPRLQAVLARLEAGEAGGLLVAKLDRLTRSVRDLGDLVELSAKQGWALMSVGEQLDTSTAAGRMVLNILGVISQWEREAIGERTRHALVQVRAEGGTLGAEALGWRRTKQKDAEGRRVVEAVETEARTLERILELRGAGLKIREITTQLEAEGHRTKAGGRWHVTTVQRILARQQQAA